MNSSGNSLPEIAKRIGLHLDNPVLLKGDWSDINQNLLANGVNRLDSFGGESRDITISFYTYGQQFFILRELRRDGPLEFYTSEKIAGSVRKAYQEMISETKRTYRGQACDSCDGRGYHFYECKLVPQAA